MPICSTAFLNEPSSSIRARSSARPSPNFTRSPKTTQSLSRGRALRARPTALAREDAAGRDRVEARAVHHDPAIDDHVGNAGRMAMRIGEGGLVTDGLRVEEREIGGIARLEEPAAPETQLGGGHARHLVDGLLPRQQPALAAVNAEDARERAVTPRVRLALVGPGPGVQRQRVRA